MKLRLTTRFQTRSTFDKLVCWRCLQQTCCSFNAGEAMKPTKVSAQVASGFGGSEVCRQRFADDFGTTADQTSAAAAQIRKPLCSNPQTKGPRFQNQIWFKTVEAKRPSETRFRIQQALFAKTGFRSLSALALGPLLHRHTRKWAHETNANLSGPRAFLAHSTVSTPQPPSSSAASVTLRASGCI